jgi:predicted RNA-binding Zn-ribbon protein involved in translation (DUF1610 family)
MYCPHCGREMQLADGVFTCDVGGMTFSQNLHDILTARFPEQRPRPVGVEVGARLLRSFCPGCGVQLEREMKCGRCGQSIQDLLWPLVELHPHADG